MGDGRFARRRILITGGLGFIGSNLARRLVEAGAHVTIVDTANPLHGGNAANLRGVEDRLKYVEADMRDAGRLGLLDGQVEYIFNLAGQSSHLDSMTDPANDLDVNCAAQLGFLEACRRSSPNTKIVFASTRQIYGRPEALPVDEDHPIRPIDVNGIHKAAAEAYHLLYHQVYGLRATALRLTNTYGPRMRVKDARQTFLGVWISKVLTGEPFEVWGGAQLRDFTFVDDVVQALMLAATSPAVDGGAFNLSGEPVVSLEELAQLLAGMSGGRFEVRPFPPERLRIDIGDYHADDRRFRALTGWTPKTPLPEGLELTLAYFRDRLQDYL